MSSTDLDEKYCNTLKTCGYQYRHFFPIRKQDNGRLYLKFKLKAHRDAHILLSPEMFPEGKSPVYEIVLGAGKNTFSTIRRKQLCEDKDGTYSEDSLVSPDEWREFWIEIKANRIQVGRKDKGVFLEWDDPEPLSIKYFSFCCWSNATVLWIFPCFKNEDFSL